MSFATQYQAAILDQAANNSEPAILFERLSDNDCYTIADAIAADADLRAAVLHDNCKGCVDTLLVSIAAAA